MTKECKLISKSYTTDAIGQKVPTESLHEVFCDVGNVSSKEFANAGSIGLKPTFVFKVWEKEYNQETTLECDSIRYSIYRTYCPGNGRIELYVEKDVSV